MNSVRRLFSYKNLLIILLLLTSCISQKKLVILQEKSKISEYKNQRYTIKLKPGDNIYVTVAAIDEKTASLFNLQSKINSGNSNNTYMSQGSNNLLPNMYLTSYTLNDSGYINFPLVEKINLAGLTLREAQKIIQDSINHYANYITATVKYVSFQITVIGEVKRPGPILVNNEQFTILEAIGFSGDFGDYANRNKITVVRKTETGNTIKYIDLTDNNVLESDYYYLRPDDVVYVAPLGAERFGLRTFQLPNYVSWMSSVISLIVLLIYLK